jgi:5-methylcytosine-specific restriction protein A
MPEHMTRTITLRSSSGFPLNAAVELSPDGIILHSRSGTDRNRDYRQALEMLMGRLDAQRISYEIYLDSRPVQHISLAQRRLTFNRGAPISSRFDELVRAMNAGSASNGAWRRLLITTPDANPSEVLAALDVNSGQPPIERLPAEKLRQVTSAHIHKAVARLLAGEDAPNFAPSRDYDALTDDGIPLAPKKVFGLALEEALGIEAYPGHFSAGWSQVCFELLEDAGLWIVPKTGSDPRPRAKSTEVEAELAGLTPTEEERSWIEGNPKIVSHLKRERQAGLAKQKRAEFIAQHGRLFCEECKLDPVEKYGPEAGPACIEVHHHRVHVANMAPGHQSLTEDLKCLCASCHRVLHRKLSLGLTQ